ncbi:mycothiol synthase, partial [Clavibacter michiganensis subsp. insidiosus]
MSAFPPPPAPEATEPDAPRVVRVEPAPDAVRGILAL